MKKKHYYKLILFIAISLTFSLIACNTNKDKEVVLSSNVLEDLNNDKLDIMNLLQRGDDYVASEDYETAKSFYEKAIMKDKMNIDTYLKIKDKYLEVNMLDDAYYFINLAIDNNVDTANMNLILDEIKSKFETITLSNTIIRLSTFTLPTTVDISLNNTDIETADVTWETTPRTNELGTFTYNGYCNKYHRTITYNLTIKKPDYSTYNGHWVTEYNSKYDIPYGIYVDIIIDTDGNLQGDIGNSTPGYGVISTVPIKGKIENNKFTCAFVDDGWAHSGKVELDFKDNSIIQRITYSSESANIISNWGIGDGTTTLVNINAPVKRTINDLRDSGWTDVAEQCFDINLNSYGKVKFISEENMGIGYHFYLEDYKCNILYRFPIYDTVPLNSAGFILGQLVAISFADINNDMLKDVVILYNHSDNSGTSTSTANIYMQQNDGTFIHNKSLEDKVNSLSNNNDISIIIDYAKNNLK